jgi:hypothetical protein
MSAAILSVSCSSSRDSAAPTDERGNTSALVQVSQVSTDPNLPAGEAWVIADPRDAKKVMAIWLGTRDTSRLGLEGAGYCGVARSFDGGKTWAETTKPFAPSDPPICGDPVGAVGPDGTVYLGAVQLGATTWMAGLASKDFGETWEPRTEIFGAEQMALAALANPGHRTPAIAAGRGFMAVDPLTGEVSVHSQEDGGVEGRWLTVSSDRGATWSVPRPIDPDIQSSTAGAHSAAGGTIAVVYFVDPTSVQYLASPTPAVVCEERCAVFATTTDQGLTWSRHVIPIDVAGGGPVTFPNHLVAADPSRLGRFAVLFTTNSGSTLEFWVTPDNGENWTQTKVLTAATGESFTKPWIAYSRGGTLGAVWRVQHADGLLTPSAMVSKNGGTAFSETVALTKTPTSPGPGLPGDDCACNLYLDATTLSATWSDASSGQRQIFYGRLDYSRLK